MLDNEEGKERKKRGVSSRQREREGDLEILKLCALQKLQKWGSMRHDCT